MAGGGGIGGFRTTRPTIAQDGTGTPGPINTGRRVSRLETVPHYYAANGNTSNTDHFGNRAHNDPTGRTEIVLLTNATSLA
jgi:hypothetical protein